MRIGEDHDLICANHGDCNYDWEPDLMAKRMADVLAAEEAQRMASRAAVVKIELELKNVWAVVYSDFRPSEVDSVWITKELAEKWVARLGGNWRVEEWAVGHVDPETGESALQGLRLNHEEALQAGTEVSRVLAAGAETPEPQP